MLLASLFDLGVPENVVLEPLRLLLPPFRATVERVSVRGISARRFHVEPLEDDPPHRTFRVIRTLLEESELPPGARDRAIAIFRALAEAEAEVHSSDVEKVHFHEVGAIDSLVDIVGVALAIDWLEPASISMTPLPLGEGTVETQHGVYPIPAPATLALLRGLPTTPYPVPREVTTPTGAAVAKVVVDRFGPPPAGTIVRTGYGAGTREAAPDEAPNVLRAWTVEAADAGVETIEVLETNVDHLTGEEIGHLIEELMAHGALDVFAVPTVGKKSRAGHLVTVLSGTGDADELEDRLFRESGTLGVRRRETSRRALERTETQVTIRDRTVRIKCGVLDGRPVTASPEYDDLRRVADETGASLRRLRAEALAAWARIDSVEQPSEPDE